MTISRSRAQWTPLPMEEETERGLPVVLRQRHRWVSPVTERKIEEAWGPKGRRQVCQVCQEERLSHRSLRLHVNAHFLLNFCLCGYHDVYPYPVTVHRMNCFPGENPVVNEDTFLEYLAIIRPSVIKALTLAALTSGFQTILKYACQQSPMVSNKPDPTPVPEQPEEAEGAVVSVPRTATPPPEKPNRLATVEERLLGLQADFTQLAPDLLNTTTGLYQLKDSVGRIKRRLCGRQVRHRSKTQYPDPLQE